MPPPYADTTLSAEHLPSTIPAPGPCPGCFAICMPLSLLQLPGKSPQHGQAPGLVGKRLGGTSVTQEPGDDPA